MKRVKKEVKLRHYVLTRIIAPFVRFFVKRSYKLKMKHYKALKKKGPFVILGNHSINIDPIIMGLHFPFHVYFIATEQVFNLGFLSSLLKYIVNPIKKSKSVSDMETIRKTKRIVEQGGSIGIFPEGNTSYSGQTGIIQPATVKLIKLLKIPVIILNMKGLYLSYPRWSIYRKKGHSHSFIKKIITPEMYLNWSDEYLYEVLKSELHVNAFEDQAESQVMYRGKKIAHGLEKLIFMDLKTNKPFVTYTKDNQLLSKDSDFKLTYLPNGRVTDQDGNEMTLIEMEKRVKIAYFNYYKQVVGDKLFEEDVKLNESLSNRKIKLGTYRLTLYKTHLLLENVHKSFILSYDEITNIVMQGKYQIIVYAKDTTYILKLDRYSSIYKYVLTFQYYQYIQLGGLSIDDNYINFGI